MHRGYLGAVGIDAEKRECSESWRKTSSDWKIFTRQGSVDPRSVERACEVRKGDPPRAADPTPEPLFASNQYFVFAAQAVFAY